jgi:uracil phosphoribosyltransferase
MKENLLNNFTTTIGQTTIKNFRHHPQLSNGVHTLLTKLRQKETRLAEYRQITRIIYESFILPEILEILPKKTIEIITGNNAAYIGSSFDSPAFELTLIDIPRAGTYPTEIIMDKLLEILPSSSIQKGVVDVKRIENPGQPLTHDVKRIVLPKNLSNPHLIITDPMLATGGSYGAVITELKKHLASVPCVFLGAVISAPEGILSVAQTLNTFTRRSIIISFDIDPSLDEKKYIVPGLGDFGDRLYFY